MELELTGKLQNIIFANTDNFYKVISVVIEDANFDFYTEDITVTGIFGELIEGDSYIFKGKLIEHPKYGDQFQCDKYEHLHPKTKDSVIKYLSGPKFKGIGKKTAEQIIDILGENAIELINSDPDVLKQVPNLTPKRKKIIVEEISANYGMEQWLIKLADLGLSNNLAMQIYHKYRDECIDKLEENPYALIDDFSRFSFKIADQIAMKFELPYNYSKRIDAAIIFSLSSYCYQTGNTYMLLDGLIKSTKILLDENFLENVILDEIADRIISLVKELQLIMQEKRVFLSEFYDAEKNIYNNILRLSSVEIDDISDSKLQKGFSQVQKDTGIVYDDIQKQAIMSAFKSNFFILTGGPGTGKTTIINCIVQLYAKVYKCSLDVADYKSLEDFPVKLAAPTGRAAKRMSESTGIKATTIHRLLGLGKDDETLMSDIEINNSLLIIDEFSMVDTKLASSLLDAIGHNVKVIFVGDKDQLPSVGPGQVLADLLKVKDINHCILEKIYRQSDESSIIDLAHQVCEGNFTSDFVHNFSDRSYFNGDAKHIESMIEKIITSAKNKGYSIQDIQVLAPMYKGIAGIDNINRIIQNLVNPKEKYKAEVQTKTGCYRVGDKVLHLVNDPENNVFNGDIGFISDIILEEYSENQIDELIISFDQNEVIYSRNDWQKITLAYCCSIHKAQGSEFPVVILPMVSQYSHKLLKRNLLYTAITRSSSKLILLGEQEVFKYCMENASDDRQTGLLELFDGKNENGMLKNDNQDFILTLEMITNKQIPAMIGIEDKIPYDFMKK